jgi:type II secretory pathway component PulK
MVNRWRPARSSDAGFALFVVLSFMLIAVAVTAPLLMGAKIQAMVTRNTWNATKERIANRGLLEMAAVRYFERYQDRSAAPAKSVSCPGVKFRFQDHGGLIDLNASSAEVLAIGLESLGLTSVQAAGLAEEVIRFRSVNTGLPVAAGISPPKYGYKHALIENTVELLELSETSGAKLKGIDGVFTVHSGTGTVDVAASQGQLAETLERLNASERFFLVNDVRRSNAVTITVAIQSNNAQSSVASAVMGTALSPGEARFVSPVSLQSGVKSAADYLPPQSLDCEDFFDPVMRDAILELAS